MLNTRYREALTGLKRQGDVTSPSFTGCEAEAQHIYRIIMAENVPVDQLDEVMLEHLINKERVGDADYSECVEHDGLEYADLEQDVELYPAVKSGACFSPISGQIYRLSSCDAKLMIKQLIRIGQLRLITETMQSLAQKADGTKLQTAFPSLHNFYACVFKGIALPASLLGKLHEWEALGATNVFFDFIEKQPERR